MFRELFESMDRWRPKVLVNTFDELEVTVISEMKRYLDVFAVGPMVAGAAGGGGSSNEERILHLYKHDDADKKLYMEWLGAHPEKSVVYVSFGSIASYTKLEVLSHPAVGCFISHCRWNSTVEAMAAGVPLVGMPGMFDQPTNAYLVEEEWEIGIRGERDGEGVLAGMELARCVELVMGQGTKATAMRERVMALKERAQLAADPGGPAEKNLQGFVSSVQQVCGSVLG